MLIPKFKIESDSTLHVTGKYISNGHWLIVKNNLPKLGQKLFKNYFNLAQNTYYAGTPSGNGLTDEACEQVIPKRDGFLPLNPGPNSVKFSDKGDALACQNIIAYVYETSPKVGDLTFKIGIQPQYVPLLNMGYAFAKDAKSPILVLDSNDLSGNLIAVIMPIRI